MSVNATLVGLKHLKLKELNYILSKLHEFNCALFKLKNNAPKV